MNDSECIVRCLCYVSMFFLSRGMQEAALYEEGIASIPDLVGCLRGGTSMGGHYVWTLLWGIVGRFQLTSDHHLSYHIMLRRRTFV